MTILQIIKRVTTYRWNGRQAKDRIQRDLEFAGVRANDGWIMGEGASSTQSPVSSARFHRQISPPWQPEDKRIPSGDQARTRTGDWWALVTGAWGSSVFKSQKRTLQSPEPVASALKGRETRFKTTIMLLPLRGNRDLRASTFWWRASDRINSVLRIT